MKIFSFIPVLAILVTAVVGAPQGQPSQVPKRNLIDHPARDIHGLTNAELLRRGLPLNDPVIRRGSPVRRTDPSQGFPPPPPPPPTPI